ncbi:MAG: hypothetical protein AAF567_02145 [Actinomycetota bacterium]
MGLLRRRINYDPFLGDKEARAAAKALDEGDWIPTMALLKGSGDHSFHMGLIAAEANIRGFHTWADNHPTGQSLTMLAMRQMADAWAIGRTKAGDRSQSEIDDAFRAQLAIADRSVAHACGKDPEMADAWAAAIPIATGLGLGLQSARSRFDRAHSLHPFHRNATISMLRAHFERWGGSHDSMFGFARWVSGEVPPYSELQAVLPIAHLEYVAANGKELIHFARRENVVELQDVVRRFIDATPREPARPEQLEALNTFVAVLGKLHPLPEQLLEECILRIDDRPTPIPWRRGENDLAEAYSTFIKDFR